MHIQNQLILTTGNVRDGDNYQQNFKALFQNKFFFPPWVQPISQLLTAENPFLLELENETENRRKSFLLFLF